MSSNSRLTATQSEQSETIWVEKYRPRELDEIVAHDEIRGTLRRLIAERTLPHLLFYGPPGTGKTTAILACAREMFGAQFKTMVLELNASDDRGIDVVREQIKTFASTRHIYALKAGIKLVILDEADAMTSAAQAALRRIMEKYTSNIRFCLICNYANKIIPAIQSRCTRFRFQPVPVAQMIQRLEYIADREGVPVDRAAFDALARIAQGDMRRAIYLMQSTFLASASARVTEDGVYANAGMPSPADLHAIAQILLYDPFAQAFCKISEIKKGKGFALLDMIHGLHEAVMLMELSPKVKAFLFEQLANMEWRLVSATSERIQLAALVGIFRLAASMIDDSESGMDPKVAAAVEKLVQGAGYDQTQHG
jgi:replication factor C subunit 3/5